MKFIVLAKYTKQGTDGWLDNPDEDRRAMISGLSEKIGGKLLDYTKSACNVKYKHTKEARDRKIDCLIYTTDAADE